MAQPHRQLRMEQKNAPRWGAFFQAVKKAFGFFDSLKNAVIFAPENGTKYSLCSTHALPSKA